MVSVHTASLRASGVAVVSSALLIVATGCSSSKPGTPGASGSTSGATTSTPSPTGSGGGSTAAASPADAATRAAVASAYADLFDSSSTDARAVAALQHGTVFAATIAKQSSGSLAQKAGVKVTKVTVHGDVADVTFTITSGGSAVLPDAGGNAVREDGRWKVAARTFCTLLKLEGDAPAACADPKITALP
jgi:hypothetical protein